MQGVRSPHFEAEAHGIDRAGLEHCVERDRCTAAPCDAHVVAATSIQAHEPSSGPGVIVYVLPCSDDDAVKALKLDGSGRCRCSEEIE